jgi:hypothetical protein
MSKELTGFYLKTGEDILEGDILKVNSFVTFYVLKGDGTIKYDYENGWVLWGLEKSVQWNLDKDTHVVKRIGNIHDNPELLTHRLGIPLKKKMKGLLQKPDGWIVLHNEEKIPLHPIDSEQLEIDTRSDILIGKSIEFNRVGLYAKYTIPTNMEIK